MIWPKNRHQESESEATAAFSRGKKQIQFTSFEKAVQDFWVRKKILQLSLKEMKFKILNQVYIYRKI
jgi:hypothetical protein